MIAASEKFQNALAYSHTALSRAVVLQPTEDNSYSETDTLEIAQGSITMDGSRNIRRQANLTLAPSFSVDLGPLHRITDASRVRVDRGIQFLDGTTEWVTIGTFTVQTATMALGGGTLTVSGYDPSSCIDDFSIITPFTPTGTVVEAIQDLVDNALWEEAEWVIDPGIDMEVRPAAGTVFSNSRWTAINTLAKSLGAVVFCDAAGRWVLAKIDTTYSKVAASLSTGEGGVIISRSSAKNRQDLFNAVTVRWEDPNGGGVVLRVDSDPQSPTYWNGPFGRRPAAEQNLPSIDSQEQANAAAEARLAEIKGFMATVDFQALHNPLLEPGDCLSIHVQGELREIHVIDSIAYTLTSGAMSCKTRVVRSAE